MRITYIFGFVIVLKTALTHAANLRATGLMNDHETSITPEQHRRRMEEISQYWTNERIHMAEPRDVHIPITEADKHRQLEVLQWMEDRTDEDEDEEYNDEELDRYEERDEEEDDGDDIHFDEKDDEEEEEEDDEEDNQYEGQIVSHHFGDVLPFATNCQAITSKRNCRKSGCGWSNKKCAEPSASLSPPPVPDTQDMCAGKRKKLCRNTAGCVFQNNICQSTSGGGTTGDSTAAATCVKITKRNKCRRNPSCVWNGSCAAGGSVTTTTTTTVAPPSVTCEGFQRRRCRNTVGCSYANGVCFATGFTPTTQAPPSTTTTTTQPTTTLPPSVDVEYILPSTSLTTDPVDFEWKVVVASGSISMVKLVIEYPGGSVAYLDRSPTYDGYDSVTIKLDAEGQFMWSIWTTAADGTVVDKGPWQSFEVEGSPQKSDRACYTGLARYTERQQDLHKAVGRIMFRFGNKNYLCSGTLVEGADDRAIIATAAHCVFDKTDKVFPDYVMFIPGQDDGEGDGSDYNCQNDPHGCFYPTFGVISDQYRAAEFIDGFDYDYGFYVAPDTDSGNDNGPDRDSYGGTAYTSLTPMPISFDGMPYGYTTHLFGYPGARDPQFMYTKGRADVSPITIGGWYVACSGLTGGASGGPWTQSDPATGQLTLRSVNSWGWANGNPGMGSPPFDNGGAECVYNAANAASMRSNDIVANC